MMRDDRRPTEHLGDRAYPDVEWIRCPRCDGTGDRVECIDDLCHAQDRCLHGQNTCKLCRGGGRISRELEERWYSRELFESVEIPAADRDRYGGSLGSRSNGDDAGGDT